MPSDESAAVMALLVLFTAMQCILAALMLALRRNAAACAWGAGLVLSCIAGLLVIDGHGDPAWPALLAPASGLGAQLLIHRGIAMAEGRHAPMPGAESAAAAAMLAVLGAAALGEGSRPAAAAGYTAAAVCATFTLAWLLPRPHAPGRRARPLVLAACALQWLAQCCGLYAVWGVSAPVAAGHAEALLLLRLLPSFVAILAGLAAFTVMTMEAMLATQERQARLDALTGLLNRGAIDSAAATLAAEYTRHGHPMSCLVIDIDRFKQINDSSGHRAGDLVLRQIAAVVANTRRATDLAGRYGGEEFCVLCPHTAEADALLLANRMLRGIRAIALPPGMGGFASASIGIAEIRGSGPGGAAAAWDRLFGRADRALYEAKRRGRGRVVSASALEAGPVGAGREPCLPACAEACH
ncbi:MULTISPECIES: diguanylate cyclase [Cupriavidus]